MCGWVAGGDVVVKYCRYHKLAAMIFVVCVVFCIRVSELHTVRSEKALFRPCRFTHNFVFVQPQQNI